MFFIYLFLASSAEMAISAQNQMIKEYIYTVSPGDYVNISIPRKFVVFNPSCFMTLQQSNFGFVLNVTQDSPSLALNSEESYSILLPDSSGEIRFSILLYPVVCNHLYVSHIAYGSFNLYYNSCAFVTPNQSLYFGFKPNSISNWSVVKTIEDFEAIEYQEAHNLVTQRIDEPFIFVVGSNSGELLIGKDEESVSFGMDDKKSKSNWFSTTLDLMSIVLGIATGTITHNQFHSIELLSRDFQISEYEYWTPEYKGKYFIENETRHVLMYSKMENQNGNYPLFNQHYKFCYRAIKFTNIAQILRNVQQSLLKVNNSHSLSDLIYVNITSRFIQQMNSSITVGQFLSISCDPSVINNLNQFKGMFLSIINLLGYDSNNNSLLVDQIINNPYDVKFINVFRSLGFEIDHIFDIMNTISQSLQNGSASIHDVLKSISPDLPNRLTQFINSYQRLFDVDFISINTFTDIFIDFSKMCQCLYNCSNHVLGKFIRNIYFNIEHMISTNNGGNIVERLYKFGFQQSELLPYPFIRLFGTIKQLYSLLSHMNLSTLVSDVFPISGLSHMGDFSNSSITFGDYYFISGNHSENHLFSMIDYFVANYNSITRIFGALGYNVTEPLNRIIQDPYNYTMREALLFFNADLSILEPFVNIFGSILRGDSVSFKDLFVIIANDLPDRIELVQKIMLDMISFSNCSVDSIHELFDVSQSIVKSLMNCSMQMIFNIVGDLKNILLTIVSKNPDGTPFERIYKLFLAEPSLLKGYPSLIFHHLASFVEFAESYDSNKSFLDTIPINISEYSYIGEVLNSTLTLKDYLEKQNINESIYSEISLVFADQYDPLMKFFNSCLCDMSLAEDLYQKINSSEFDIAILDILKLFNISFGPLLFKIDIIGRVLRHDYSLKFGELLSIISPEFEQQVIDLIKDIRGLILLENLNVSYIYNRFSNLAQIINGYLYDTFYDICNPIINYFESFILSTDRGDIKERLSLMKEFVNNVFPNVVSMADYFIQTGKSMFETFSADFNLSTAFPLSTMLANYSHFFEWNFSIGQVFGCIEYSSECSNKVVSFVNSHQEFITCAIQSFGYDFSMFEPYLNRIISNPYDVSVAEVLDRFGYSFSKIYQILDLFKSLSIEGNEVLMSSALEIINPGLFDQFCHFSNQTLYLLNLYDTSPIFFSEFKESFMIVSQSIASVFITEINGLLGSLNSTINTIIESSINGRFEHRAIRLLIHLPIPEIYPVRQIMNTLRNFFNLSIQLNQLPIIQPFSGSIFSYLFNSSISEGEIVYYMSNSSSEFVTNTSIMVSENIEMILFLIKSLGYESLEFENLLENYISDPYSVQVRQIIELFNIQIPSVLNIVDVLGSSLRGEQIYLSDFIAAISPSLVSLVQSINNDFHVILSFNESSISVLPNITQHLNEVSIELFNSVQRIFKEIGNSIVSFIDPIIFGQNGGNVLYRAYNFGLFIHQNLPEPLKSIIKSINRTQQFLMEINLSEIVDFSNNNISKLVNMFNTSLTFGDLFFIINNGSSEQTNYSLMSLKANQQRIGLFIRVLGFESELSNEFVLKLTLHPFDTKIIDLFSVFDINISRILVFIDLFHNILVGDNINGADILNSLDSRLPALFENVVDLFYEVISFKNLSIYPFVDFLEYSLKLKSIMIESIIKIPLSFIHEMCILFSTIINTNNMGSIDQRMIHLIRHFSVINPLSLDFFNKFNSIYDIVSHLSLSVLIKDVISIPNVTLSLSDINVTLFAAFRITNISLSDFRYGLSKYYIPITSLLRVFNLSKDNFVNTFNLLYSNPSIVRFIDLYSSLGIEYKLLEPIHKTIIRIYNHDNVTFGELLINLPNNANSTFISMISSLQTLSNNNMVSISDLIDSGKSLYSFVFSLIEGIYFVINPSAMIPPMTPIPTPDPTLSMTNKATHVPTFAQTPALTPKRSPFMTLLPTIEPTTIPPTPHPYDSLCIGESSSDLYLCPSNVFAVDGNGLSTRLNLIKSESTTNSLDIYIVGPLQVQLSLQTLQNKVIKIKGYTQGASILLDFVCNPLSLDLSNINVTFKNSSLTNQRNLVISVDTLHLSKLTGAHLYNSISNWTLNCNVAITDFESFSMFKILNIHSQLTITEGLPTTTTFPYVFYNSNSKLVISSFFEDIKVLPGELLIGIGNDQYINVFGAPITEFSNHKRLSVGGSSSIKSIKSDESLPKTSFIMGSNSIIIFSGSFPEINGEDPFSLSSNGLCSLQMSGPAPIQYDTGSKLQIGFVTAKYVDFSKILDADLSIGTETEGSVQSITFTDSGIVIKNANNESVSVPVNKDIVGGLAIVNQNQVGALIIDINVSNKSAAIMVPVSIVLTEKSKTFISESFSNVTLTGNLTIQTSTTNVDVKLASGVPTGTISIIGSDGSSIPLSQLGIFPEPTPTKESGVSSWTYISASTGGLGAAGFAVFNFLRKTKIEAEESSETVQA